MPLTVGGTAPYAPPATVIEVLTRYRERGLATPFTSEVLERAGVPETLSNRTLQALKLLEFVDAEGKPTEQMEALSRVPDGDYKERFGEMIIGVYTEVISFADPATDSYERVRDAFRPYNPRGQQDRMVTLFLGLLEHAGMDVSAANATRSRKRAEAGQGARKTAAIKTSAPKTGARPAARRVAKGGASADPDAGNATDDLPPGLIGLLRQIPRGGAGWPKARRDEFMAAFGAVLDFSVPVRNVEPAPAAVAEDAEGEAP